MPIPLAEFGPQGEAGVVQSPNPVRPTTEVTPVTGSIATRLPEKPRVSKALPGPWTSPPPTSGGKAAPIGRNVPLCKSTAPNCELPVITYTKRLWPDGAAISHARDVPVSGTASRPYDGIGTVGAALDKAG